MTETIDSFEDILEFAIHREVQANAFYLALAGRMVNPQKQQVFEELANEEMKHKERLELEVLKTGKVVKSAAADQGSEINYDIVGVDGGLDMEYKDMLALAISKERASFRLYVDLAGRAKDEKTREVLLELAEEEAKHKFRFEIEYDTFLKNKNE